MQLRARTYNIYIGQVKLRMSFGVNAMPIMRLKARYRLEGEWA